MPPSLCGGGDTCSRGVGRAPPELGYSKEHHEGLLLLQKYLNYIYWTAIVLLKVYWPLGVGIRTIINCFVRDHYSVPINNA